MKPIVGKYIPKDSFIHSLDPRCKLLCLLLISVEVILVNNNLYYILPFLIIFYGILASRVKISTYLKGLKSILFLLIFAAAIQLFCEGVNGAIFIFLRLSLILLAAEVFTFTTSPTQIARSMEFLLRIFGFSRKSAQEFSIIMMIAIRFAPIMMEEAQRITKAQIARGAPINSGKLFQRMKALTAIIVPLMVSAIRKAEELSLAMEARRYRPGIKRTNYKRNKWRTSDTLIISVVVSSLIALVLLRI